MTDDQTSQPAWTPGPWRTDPWGHVSGGGMAVTAAWTTGEREPYWRANAHLIAAAPSLYAALEDTASVCEYVLSKPDAYDEQFGQLVHAHLEAARAALAKARGQ